MCRRVGADGAAADDDDECAKCLHASPSPSRRSALRHTLIYAKVAGMAVMGAMMPLSIPACAEAPRAIRTVFHFFSAAIAAQLPRLFRLP